MRARWLVWALWATCLAACTAGGARRGPGTGSDGGGRDGSTGPDGSVSFGCEPGAGGCDGNVWYECGADGRTRTNEITCDDACDPNLRCVLCRPGTRRCEGTVSLFCAANGLGWVTGRDCSEWGSTCGGDGYCADLCGEAEASRSNVGCEYWPVPLANTGELDQAVFDYRVVVANPNDVAANITVTRGGSMVWMGTIAPRELSEIALPWIDGQSFGIPGDDWRSLVVANGAYRLKSDAPVIVSQFNPFEYSASGVFSYTNDATLLLPSHVLTGDYLGVSYYPLSRRTSDEGGFGGGSASTIRYGGYIAVVGVAPEPTRIEVRAAGAVAADAGGRIPATARGGSFTMMLSQGEVVHIAAAPPPECTESRPGFNRQRECESFPFGGEICENFDTCAESDHDLTGTSIRADRPVAVFGGHVCAYVPYSAQACDHLENQMPPIQSWGREYVSAPMTDGGGAGRNLVRIVAAFDGTMVTVDPPQDGYAGGTLAAGQWVELYASSPFHVTGSAAIMVSQYLLGQYSTDPPSARGDPAMTVLVPSEQYRNEYTFILPSSYNETTNGQNFLMIVRPPGLALTLDGAAVSATWQTIAGREIGVVPLPGGTHRIQAAETFGVIAYGMGSFTSYATPGGLNLEQITILF